MSAVNRSDVSTVHEFGRSPFLIFCDHATNNVPDDYKCLGMPADVLQTHIAWDPGAANVSLALGGKLECPVLLSNFSRLLIDPNRSADRDDLIPMQSDLIPIPGNHNLTYEERCQRIDRFHRPYHDALDQLIGRSLEQHEKIFVLSIHSFTPRLMGETEDRPWHLGVLWRHDERSAKRFIDNTNANTEYCVGDNEPYDAREFNYSVDRHIAPRKLSHLTLEIRQDLITDQQGVEEIADCIFSQVKQL